MAHSKAPSTPQAISPTLSTSSSSSLSPEDLGLLQHGYSPASRAAKLRTYGGAQVSPSPSAPSMARTISLDAVMERKASLAGTSVGEEPVVEVEGKGKAPQRVRRERQTRISEHLQAVKPGSPSPSASSKSSATSTSRSTVVVPAKRSHKKKVVVVVEEPLEPLEKQQARMDVVVVSEAEAEARLAHEKEQLMTKLATYGLAPHPDVLDKALRTMALSGTAETTTSIDSFLSVLSSLTAKTSPASAASPSNLPAAPYPSVLAPVISSSPRKRQHQLSVSFSTTLASPVSTSPTRQFTPSPTQRAVPALSPAAFISHTSPSFAFTSSARLAPSPEIGLTTSSPLREGRLHAFALRRSDSSGSSSMVAAEVQGMGRVAMAREVLFDQLGSATAEQAIFAARTKAEPLQALAFGLALPSEGGLVIDAFGARTRREDGVREAVVVDERMGLVRSWLDSPELVEEESRETWSTIPTEWDADLDPFDKAPLEQVVQYAEVEMEQEEIRVGGKSVRVLLRTKRKVQEDDEAERKDDEEEVVENDDVSALSDIAPPKKYKLQRSNSHKKGKSRETIVTTEEVDCVCDRGDDGKPMARCEDCITWFHLECLGIPSLKQLPKEWFCYRCTGEPIPSGGPSPSKRTKLHQPSTPVLYAPSTPVLYSEPILVASSFSPRPKGNFYASNGADTVLAPSPQSSPSRRFIIPRTPTIATPVTPILGHSRADYSPRSPLYYRSGRTRTVSGAFEDGPGQSGWVSGWDGQVFGTATAYEEIMAPLDEDDWQPRSWNDMTMTPSRATCTSALGWNEPGLLTPSTSSRRNRVPSSSIGMTPSQDFLSGLHSAQGQRSSQDQQQQEAQTYAYAQRLFAPSPTTSRPVVPSSSNGPFYTVASSPLGPRSRTISNNSNTRRNPSFPLAFSQSPASPNRPNQQPYAAAPQNFINPFPSPERRVVSSSRAAHYQATSSPKLGQQHSVSGKTGGPGALEQVTPQSSGMARTASGLGIGGVDF